jgi:hypothetical protein
VLAEQRSTVVADQVDLNEPGPLIVPVGPGADRDLGLQQRPGFGVGSAPHREPGPFHREPAVDGGGAHADQQVGLGVGDLQLLIPAQHRHQDRQYRRQPLPRRGPQHRPAQHERGDHVGAVDRPARRAGFDHPRPQSPPQRAAGVVAVPAGQLDQLIENPALRGPIRASIRPRLDHRHRSPLTHRQPHHPGVRPGAPPAGSGAPGWRTFPDEATYRPTRTFQVSQRADYPHLASGAYTRSANCRWDDH